MQVFLSYSHRDKEAVGQTAEFLTAQGFAVWWDNEILPGEDWAAKLQDALEDSDALIVFLSPEAAQSAWVEAEINYAFRQELRIIPILLRGTPQTALPISLENLQYLDASRQNLPEVLPRLLAALKKFEAEEMPLTLQAVENPQRNKRRSFIASNVVISFALAFISLSLLGIAILAPVSQAGAALLTALSIPFMVALFYLPLTSQILLGSKR